MSACVYVCVCVCVCLSVSVSVSVYVLAKINLVGSNKSCSH